MAGIEHTELSCGFFCCWGRVVFTGDGCWASVTASRGVRGVGVCAHATNNKLLATPAQYGANVFWALGAMPSPFRFMPEQTITSSCMFR